MKIRQLFHAYRPTERTQQALGGVLKAPDTLKTFSMLHAKQAARSIWSQNY
jgi:hypothetical protein